jgi:hypothetical protein
MPPTMALGSLCSRQVTESGGKRASTEVDCLTSDSLGVTVPSCSGAHR